MVAAMAMRRSLEGPQKLLNQSAWKGIQAGRTWDRTIMNITVGTHSSDRIDIAAP
jgi:hypothetical protein